MRNMNGLPPGTIAAILCRAFSWSKNKTPVKPGDICKGSAFCRRTLWNSGTGEWVPGYSLPNWVHSMSGTEAKLLLSQNWIYLWPSIQMRFCTRSAPISQHTRTPHCRLPPKNWEWPLRTLKKAWRKSRACHSSSFGKAGVWQRLSNSWASTDLWCASFGKFSEHHCAYLFLKPPPNIDFKVCGHISALFQIRVRSSTWAMLDWLFLLTLRQNRGSEYACYWGCRTYGSRCIWPAILSIPLRLASRAIDIAWESAFCLSPTGEAEIALRLYPSWWSSKKTT